MAEKWIPRVGERVQLLKDGEAVISAIIGNEAPYVYEVTQNGKIPEVFHVGIDDMERIERPSFDSFLCEEGDEVLILGCSKYQGRIGIFEGIEPALEGMFHVVHFDRDPSRHAFKEEHILPMKIFDTRIELAITKALNVKRREKEEDSPVVDEGTFVPPKSYYTPSVSQGLLMLGGRTLDLLSVVMVEDRDTWDSIMVCLVNGETLNIDKKVLTSSAFIEYWKSAKRQSSIRTKGAGENE